MDFIASLLSSAIVIFLILTIFGTIFNVYCINRDQSGFCLNLNRPKLTWEHWLEFIILSLLGAIAIYFLQAKEKVKHLTELEILNYIPKQQRQFLHLPVVNERCEPQLIPIGKNKGLLKIKDIHGNSLILYVYTTDEFIRGIEEDGKTMVSNSPILGYIKTSDFDVAKKYLKEKSQGLLNPLLFPYGYRRPYNIPPQTEQLQKEEAKNEGENK